jgi:hypothetical protein
MNPKYNIGQRVVIRPIKEQILSARDCTIEPYGGQIGQVTQYYWISPRVGEVLFIYEVRVLADDKEIVLHEDEIREAQGVSR